MNAFARLGLRSVAAMAAAVAISGASPSASAQSGPPSGSVTLHVLQAAYVGGVSRGEGVLTFRGRNYPFTTTGAGAGGIGLSRFDGSGTVYNLKSAADFAGPYAQIRTGLAIGQFGGGRMMLRNANDVVIRLNGMRRGLALSTGADAMVFSFER